MSLEQAHLMRQDNAIQSLQQSVAQLSRKLEQLVVQFNNLQEGHRAREPNDHGDEQDSSDSRTARSSRRGGRRPPIDEFRDIKEEPLEFNGNLNPDENLEWVQALDQIFEAKAYDDERSFKGASLKLTRYASLRFENIKKQRARGGKRRINSLEKLKTHMNKRFFPKSYKQDIHN